ncbi:hypothetical protein DPZ46_10390 [Salmonella enterica subsp. enterica serovar Meleagridis]|nr:hypothetical protein [Salmonella enterica subsp. enterica serovar Meleagridis]EGO0386328.1 hypothetical protein [Salmonella enterica]EHI7879843.1 hypothetical protein [Salmonella enterica]
MSVVDITILILKLIVAAL